MIRTGWPDPKENTLSEIHPYYHFREMRVQDGLVFKGNRVGIPLSLRKEIKEALHSTHSSTGLRRARECVYDQ